MDLCKILSRKEIIQKSLDNFGYILIAENMDEAIEAANAIASEHMEIVTANPFEVMMKDPKCRCDLYRRDTAPSRWATILQDRTTYCRQTEQRSSSLLFL